MRFILSYGYVKVCSNVNFVAAVLVSNRDVKSIERSQNVRASLSLKAGLVNV